VLILFSPPRLLQQNWFEWLVGARGFYSPPTATVTVFRNGDGFYPGRRFVTNQRQSFTFDSFLNTVTRGITAPFGAVRNIYTPNKGHKVLDLEQLVHGERYWMWKSEQRDTETTMKTTMETTGTSHSHSHGNAAVIIE